jgi:hypothetical protein
LDTRSYEAQVRRRFVDINTLEASL